jgi:hypothetical protein
VRSLDQRSSELDTKYEVHRMHGDRDNRCEQRGKVCISKDHGLVACLSEKSKLSAPIYRGGLDQGSAHVALAPSQPSPTVQ